MLGFSYGLFIGEFFQKSATELFKAGLPNLCLWRLLWTLFQGKWNVGILDSAE
jgi:hypothetical protein